MGSACAKREADCAVEELNWGLPSTKPFSERVKDLNQGPPDFKSSALNHSATLPLQKAPHFHQAYV